MTLKIRIARTSDLDLVANLVNSAYRGEYSKQGWTTEADFLGGQRTDALTLENELTQPGQSMELLFDETSTLVGCVFLKDEPEDVLYFGMLTVEPKKQDRGFGKVLLKHIESLAEIRQKKRMRMTVIDLRQELIAYYKRRGYEFTGKVEPFPMDDPNFGIPKQPLRLLVFEKKLIT